MRHKISYDRDFFDGLVDEMVTCFLYTFEKVYPINIIFTNKIFFF